MTISRRRFITITAGLALGSAVLPNNAKAVSWRGIALGAQAKLVITGLPENEAHRLIGLARTEIERLENIFSIYRNDSAISTLNKNGLLQSPPFELLELLTTVDAVYKATGGKFDPTIQPLWRAYGENRGAITPAVLGKTKRTVGWQHVQFDNQAIQFAKPEMAMTLNGIAQGFVTDRIASLLKTEGLENAVINVGEITVLGYKSGTEPWQIGIAEHGDDSNPQEFVPLINQAIATSAPYGTTFKDNTSHIINPVTGRPISSQWQRISVIHKSAAIADGLSTALVMMNEAEMQKSAQQIGDSKIIAKYNAKHNDGATIRYQS
jgi:thiamine biosynthesis lipoprotein